MGAGQDPARGRAHPDQHPAGAGGLSGVSGDRCGQCLPGHPHQRARPGALRRHRGAAAGRAQLCRRVHLGLGGRPVVLDRPLRGLLAGGAGAHPLHLPLRLPAGGRRARRRRPGAGGGRTVTGARPLEHAVQRHPAAGAPGHRGGRPACRALCARRLRGGVDPAGGHLHPGDLHRVHRGVRPDRRADPVDPAAAADPADPAAGGADPPGRGPLLQPWHVPSGAGRGPGRMAVGGPGRPAHRGSGRAGCPGAVHAALGG